MKQLSLSIAAILFATQALAGTVILAQSPAQSSAKPSPYEGVSRPPVDSIDTTEQGPAQPPTTSADAAAPSAPAPATSAPSLPPASAAASRAAAPAAQDDADGIVLTPVADDTTATAATVHAAPALQSRSASSGDDDIVSSVPVPDNEAPEGTPIHARMDQQISSRESPVGTPWSAKVSRDVTVAGRVVIPAGSIVRGRVSHAEYGHRIAGPASLRLNPESVDLPDGTHYLLHAVVSETGPNTKVKGDEGTIESKDHPKRMAVEAASGTGGGAVLGAAVAGPAGAVAGTVIGAGVVTAHWLIEDHAAVLPRDSEIVFGLTRPLVLTPTTAQAAPATTQAAR
jgi:hypothetical protein